MYRRIEKIDHEWKSKTGAFAWEFPPPGGWEAAENEEYWDVMSGTPVPNKKIRKNCRFYFTEEGWKKLGRRLASYFRRNKVEFRVITIKEKSVDIFYKDWSQVAVRPRKAVK